MTTDLHRDPIPAPAPTARPTRSPRRLLAASLVVCALALGLAGCGAAAAPDDVATLAEGESASPDTTAKKALTDEERTAAFSEFAKCMREHGVDMPDPDTSGDGPVRIEARGGKGDAGGEGVMKKADEACKPLLADVMQEGPKGIDPEQEAKMRERALEFTKCMREHGVDVPDPTFEEGGGMTQRMTGDPSSPTFKAAQEACGSPIGDGEELPEGGEGIIIGGGPAGDDADAGAAVGGGDQ